MAVDFTRFPPEAPVPDTPPSTLVWTIVFFVLATAGVFAVLLFWPKDEPAQTPWFWICVTVYPFGLAAFVVLRRYSAYEGRRLDAIAWNQARHDHMNNVFDEASRPIAVLATACRFSSDASDDHFDKVMYGSVKLEPQALPKPDAPPVNARWFEKPDANENHIRFTQDDERRPYVLAWAFSAVMDALAESLHSLPVELKLKVELVLPGMTNPDEVQAIWNQQWNKSNFRPVPVKIFDAPPDLMHVDAWLDRIDPKRDEEARLIACVRLNDIYQALPPDGSAEAVVAMLLAPEAACRSFKLAPLAMLHRPNGVAHCPIDDALARALQWGRVDATEVKRVWRGGLDTATGNEVTKALVKAGIGAKLANVDHTVGHAGVAAPWLVAAYAACAAARDGAPQLVVTTDKAGACFAVLRNIKR
ncbi:hypothetical protein [Burkholderia sp. 22PA0106]|uniref:hypothetical protein n=1 Tax=Burkholderia sp. 22PA0106 TaxID=3237371 RepID=UPI0039C0C07D